MVLRKHQNMVVSANDLAELCAHKSNHWLWLNCENCPAFELHQVLQLLNLFGAKIVHIKVLVRYELLEIVRILLNFVVDIEVTQGSVVEV